MKIHARADQARRALEGKQMSAGHRREEREKGKAVFSESTRSGFFPLEISKFETFGPGALLPVFGRLADKADSAGAVSGGGRPRPPDSDLFVSAPVVSNAAVGGPGRSLCAPLRITGLPSGPVTALFFFFIAFHLQLKGLLLIQAGKGPAHPHSYPRPETLQRRRVWRSWWPNETPRQPSYGACSSPPGKNTHRSGLRN